MSIKSNLAKLVPSAIQTKQAEKYEFEGDSWGTVNTIIRKMCRIEYTKEGATFFYKDKEVGWAKNDARQTSWMDASAYRQMKEEYMALPEEVRNPPIDMDELESECDCDCSNCAHRCDSAEDDSDTETTDTEEESVENYTEDCSADY
jgi:hypothetical protein